MNTFLKPYVYKIEGIRNYALYDLFNRNLFQITPEGNVNELKKSLASAGLIFDTNGIVPFKVQIDLNRELIGLYLKELQIRLDGYAEDACWTRQKVDPACREMETGMLDSIFEQFKCITIKKTRIECDTFSYERIHKVVAGIACTDVEIFCRSFPLKDELEKLQKEFSGARRSITCQTQEPTIDKTHPISISNLHTNLYDFFYFQNFNPCLGHQLAIDTDGTIKPCLWSKEIVGQLGKSDIKQLIVANAFSLNWNLPKSKIETCTNCEFRFACMDCRVLALSGTGNRLAKTPFCGYSPETGEWSDGQ